MGITGAWLAANAGTIAAGTAAVASVAAADDSQRRAKHGKQDMERAAAGAEVTASNNANARIQMQRKAMSENSLLTGGGAAPAGAPGGRTTLGV